MGWMLAAGALLSAFGAAGAAKGASDNRKATADEIEAATARYNAGISGVGNTFYGPDLYGAISNPIQYAPPKMPTREEFSKPAGTNFEGGKIYGSFNKVGYDAAMQQYQESLKSYNQTYGSDSAARQAYIDRQTGGSVLSQMQDLTRRSGQGRAGIMGQYNQQTGQLAQGDQAAYSQMGQFFGQGRNAVAAMDNRRSALAQMWGHGADKLIDEQSALDLKRANASTASLMAGRGLGGSSINAMLQAGNARGSSLANRQQKLGVSQGALDRTLSAQGDAASRQAQMYGQAGSALTGMQDAMRGRQYARAGGRTEQQYANLNTDLGYRGQIPNTMLALQQGALNPGGTPYIPNPYGAGAGLVDLGSAAGGLGGNLMGAYIQNQYGQNAGGGGYNANANNPGQQSMYDAMYRRP